MTIENKYKVKQLIYNIKAFVYCPLGEDWGYVTIKAIISPDKLLPDYCDIDNYIQKNIENKTYITEEVGYLVHEYIKNEIHPSSLVVIVHSDNNSVHSCQTSISD